MRMMLQKLATHIWPKDQPGLRFRVAVAMSLLIGAKVLLLVMTENRRTLRNTAGHFE